VGGAADPRRRLPRVHRHHDSRRRDRQHHRSDARVHARRAEMTMAPTASTPIALAPLAPVRVPPRSLRNDVRAVKIVWHRDLLRFFRARPRCVTAFLQPLLYLFVLGTGLSSMTGGGGLGLRAFLFPGVMAMAVLFTCFFSAGSLVWDREFGFMREM